MNVILNTDSKIFHRKGCIHITRMRKDIQQSIDYEEALSKRYLPCSCCSTPKKLTKDLKKKGFDTIWDRKYDACCIRTDVGFWRAVYSYKTYKWVLYHMNNSGTKCFDPNSSNEELLNGAFHLQKDFSPNGEFDNIIKYIGAHEHSVRVKRGDYRNLPKKYRRAEKNRKKRKGIREVRKLINQLEKERKIKGEH